MNTSITVSDFKYVKTTVPAVVVGLNQVVWFKEPDQSIDFLAIPMCFYCVFGISHGTLDKKIICSWFSGCSPIVQVSFES